MTPTRDARSYSWIRHLAGSLWLNHDPGRCWMAMYTCYYDASSTQLEKEKPLVVVGVLSTERRWLRFEREWGAVLKRFGVPYLHMKEFAHSVGPFAAFKGDEPRRAEFLGALVKAMKRNINKAFQYRLVPGAYGDLDREFELSETWGGPYAFTTSVTVNQTQFWFEEKYPKHQLAHVVEKGDPGQEDLYRLSPLDDNPVTIRPKIDKRTGEWFKPFQAADFFAYEARLNIGRHLAGETHVARQSLLLLRRRMPHQAYYFDLEYLREQFALQPEVWPRRRPTGTSEASPSADQPSGPE